MQLLVIRHGVAEQRETFGKTGKDDALRPLTQEGVRKMERNAAALRRVLDSLDVLGTSPLVRATQTALIVASVYPTVTITTIAALEPDSPLDSFMAWLTEQRDATRVAIVGHEPHLSTLVTWLMSGREESRVSMRKGGACLLEFNTRPQPGGATLLWALTPAIMRRISD